VHGEKYGFNARVGPSIRQNNIQKTCQKCTHIEHKTLRQG
jgi:hypothetical protein